MPLLLDRLRIDRRTDGAGNRKRWSDEEKFVHTVLRAISGKRLQVENLTNQHPHVHDCNAVERLKAIRRLIG